MEKSPAVKLNDLYMDFVNGKIDRRTLLAGAGALGLSAASVAMFARAIPASAQDASPVAETYEPQTSMTREEFKAKLAGDFPFTADPAAGSEGGQFIYGELASSFITTTNILLAADSPTLPVMGLVFETLIGADPTNGQYVPGLADYWTIAEDGKTYTFYINADAMWHDGTPVTADDCVFSCDAQADETTGSAYTGTFNMYVESYRAIDEKTFEIVAKDVVAPVVFLGNSYFPVMPKHVWESVPFAEWASDPGSTGDDPSRVVGCGMFKFGELNASEGTVTLVRNDEYYDVKPIIEEFIFQTWPEETSAIEALRTGAIDIYDGVPPTDVESIQAEESLEVALYDTYSFSWYGYNMDPEKTTLFQDVKVRQALVYALDRQSMVDNILLGFAEVANGSQPILSIAYAPDKINTVYNFDPEKAAALLDEAGWVLNGDVREKDGVKLSFKIMYGSGSPTTDSIVAAVQDYWKAIGVDGQPDPVDFGTVLVPALLETFDYEMCLLGFNWDATGDQFAMFGTDSYGQGFNAMKYSNPAYDELAIASGKELDEAKRVEDLIEATNIVNDDVPVCVLWFSKNRTGYNVRVHNFAPTGVSLLWSLPYVWVDAS